MTQNESTYLDTTTPIGINSVQDIANPVSMWETDPDKKPADNLHRLCGNNEIGCFMARWNGIEWLNIAGFKKVEWWLRTPKDIE